MIVRFGLGLPKLRSFPPSAAHRSPPVARLSCSRGSVRLQSIRKFRLPSVHGRADHSGHGLHCRVVRRIDAADLRALEVLPEVGLERRLAVAKQVVGDAHARCDVVVALDAHRALERDRLRVEDRRLGRAVALGRRPAPGAVVANRPLQRQLAQRPLILGEEGRRHRVIGRVPPRGEDVAEADGIPVVERVAQLRIVGDPPGRLHQAGAHVADLEVVRAGDIRRRRPPLDRAGFVVRKGVSVRIVEPAIAEVRESIDRRLLGDRNQVGEPIGRHLAVAREPVVEPREPRVEEQPVRHRRRPGGLRHVVGQVVVTGKRLGRVGGVPNRDPVPAARPAALAVFRQRGALTPILILLGERHPVARRHLFGQPDREDVVA